MSGLHAGEKPALQVIGGGFSPGGGSLLSRVVTGYGVQIIPTASIMLLIYLASTAVYLRAGIEDPFYYSIVTFTTAPPRDPSGDLLTKLVEMVETFTGTLLIVLLGYILGNREQV